MQGGGKYSQQLELDAFVRAAAEDIRTTALENRARHGAQIQRQDVLLQLKEQLDSARSECARMQALIDRAAAAGFIMI